MKHKKIAGYVLVAVLAGAAFWMYFRETSFGKLPALTLKRHGAGNYSFLVNGKPFVVKGVCYMPIPAGKTHDYNFWSRLDILHADGKKMKELGVNTVRFYRDGPNPEQVKKYIRTLYRKYDIRSFMGHDLGFWDWPPPNYAVPEFREKVKGQVLEMVRHYQHETGILGWILGNENNYSFEVMNVQSWTTPELEAIEDPQKRSDAKAEIYYKFINELALAIKEIDPVHPVIMGVGETKSLAIAGKFATAIDLIGMIVYRGPSFGNLFGQIKERFDRPVVLIEWGADSYDVAKDQEAEDKQAEFIRSQWKDISRNLTRNGKGNCIGGTLFEWHDEWWKANDSAPESWNVQEKAGQFSNAAYYFDYDVPGRLNMNEEWYGIMSLVPEPGKTDGRKPKKAYNVLKELWK